MKFENIFDDLEEEDLYNERKKRLLFYKRKERGNETGNMSKMFSGKACDQTSRSSSSALS